MNPRQISIVVTTTGVLRTIYQDDVHSILSKIGPYHIKRASNVEWEKMDLVSGWTVRAAHDPELAIRAIIKDGAFRQVVSKEGELLFFNNREAALEAEVRHFWQLLPPVNKEK